MEAGSELERQQLMQRQEMLAHELKDAMEREKALEEAQRCVVDALNEKIHSQSQELVSKDQKCMKLEEELRRQEALARDRKS